MGDELLPKRSTDKYQRLGKYIIYLAFIISNTVPETENQRLIVINCIIMSNTVSETGLIKSKACRGRLHYRVKYSVRNSLDKNQRLVVISCIIMSNAVSETALIKTNVFKKSHLFAGIPNRSELTADTIECDREKWTYATEQEQPCWVSYYWRQISRDQHPLGWN